MLPHLGAETAAVLACGPRALVSHRWAAHVWGLVPRPEGGVVEIMVVGRAPSPRQGIRLHKVGRLASADVRRIEGVPITSPARILIDLAGVRHDDRELERTLHEALARRLVRMADVRRALERYPGRRGCALLAELAASSQPTTATHPGAEEYLLSHLRCSGLPQPRVNSKIGIWEVDFYWPEARLVVETDGADFHSSRSAIERDHRKDLALRGQGIDVMRFTGRQVVREVAMVLVAIAREYERGLAPPQSSSGIVS